MNVRERRLVETVVELPTGIQLVLLALVMELHKWIRRTLDDSLRSSGVGM